MAALPYQTLREQARRLTESNQRLLAKIIESIDSEKPLEDGKEPDKNDDQSQIVFRRSASQPF